MISQFPSSSPVKKKAPPPPISPQRYTTRLPPHTQIPPSTFRLRAVLPIPEPKNDPCVDGSDSQLLKEMQNFYNNSSKDLLPIQASSTQTKFNYKQFIIYLKSLIDFSVFSDKISKVIVEKTKKATSHQPRNSLPTTATMMPKSQSFFSKKIKELEDGIQTTLEIFSKGSLKSTEKDILSEAKECVDLIKNLIDLKTTLSKNREKCLHWVGSGRIQNLIEMTEQLEKQGIEDQQQTQTLQDMQNFGNELQKESQKIQQENQVLKNSCEDLIHQLALLPEKELAAKLLKEEKAYQDSPFSTDEPLQLAFLKGLTEFLREAESLWQTKNVIERFQKEQTVYQRYTNLSEESSAEERSLLAGIKALVNTKDNLLRSYLDARTIALPNTFVNILPQTVDTLWLDSFRQVLINAAKLKEYQHKRKVQFSEFYQTAKVTTWLKNDTVNKLHTKNRQYEKQKNHHQTENILLTETKNLFEKINIFYQSQQTELEAIASLCLIEKWLLYIRIVMISSRLSDNLSSLIKKTSRYQEQKNRLFQEAYSTEKLERCHNYFLMRCHAMMQSLDLPIIDDQDQDTLLSYCAKIWQWIEGIIAINQKMSLFLDANNQTHEMKTTTSTDNEAILRSVEDHIEKNLSIEIAALEQLNKQCQIIDQALEESRDQYDTIQAPQEEGYYMVNADDDLDDFNVLANEPLLVIQPDAESMLLVMPEADQILSEKDNIDHQPAAALSDHNYLHFIASLASFMEKNDTFNLATDLFQRVRLKKGIENLLSHLKAQPLPKKDPLIPELELLLQTHQHMLRAYVQQELSSAKSNTENDAIDLKLNEQIFAHQQLLQQAQKFNNNLQQGDKNFLAQYQASLELLINEIGSFEKESQEEYQALLLQLQQEKHDLEKKLAEFSQASNNQQAALEPVEIRPTTVSLWRLPDFFDGFFKAFKATTGTNA